MTWSSTTVNLNVSVSIIMNSITLKSCGQGDEFLCRERHTF